MIWFSTNPSALTDATPSVVFNSGRMVSSIYSLDWLIVCPSTEADTAMMGIILGFSFRIVGLPASSGSALSIRSSISRISVTQASISASSTNFRTTIELFSWEIELTSSTLLTLAIACSMGAVMVVSISSGEAPTYVVETTA